MVEVVVFGPSGYAGQELLRLLPRHREVRLVPPADRAETFARASAGQVAFLAIPHEASADLAPELLERGLRIIDLSGAFRLTDPRAYPEWYGFVHPCPSLLAEAHYGLPELFTMPAGVRLIANPGCYATAAALAVAPFLGLFEGPAILDGKSGTTGAGKKADEAFSFSEVADNLRAYRVGKHQHTPEIERALGVPVSLTAHLIPMRRGILVTAYLRAKPAANQRTIDDALDAFTRDRPFLRRVARPPETKHTLHTNLTELGAQLDPRTGTIIAFAAIDNLVKGAAGQAIQNLNLMLGLPVETGLTP